MADRLAVDGLHQLHRFGGQAGLDQGLLHQPRQCLVGIDRFGAAAQDAGVAALDGQAGRLDGHVGTAFEDHAEHADGHPHPAHANAAGLLLQFEDLAHDVGHRGELVAPHRHGFDDPGRELEPVEQRRLHPGGRAALQVLAVFRLQRPGLAAQQPGQPAQRVVARGGIRRGHGRGGPPGFQPQRLHVLGDVRRIHVAIILCPLQGRRRPTRGRIPGTARTPAGAGPASRRRASPAPSVP